MELIRRKRPRLATQSVGGRGDLCHDLQLYVHPPTCKIQLSELYDLAIERMKVLRIVEQILPRVPSKNLDDKISAVLHELKKQGLKTYAKLLISTGQDQTEAGVNDRLKDRISHFVVRLAHSHSEELRSWFLARELDLFRLRFHSLNMQGVRNFLAVNKLGYSPISEDEKNSVLGGLLSSTSNMTHAGVESTDFYKVPFTDVVDLVSTRRIYLSRGNAYIPNRDLLSVVSTVFRHNLYGSLRVCANHIVNMEEDERIKPLTDLHKLDFAETRDFSKVQGTIAVEDLDPLSRVSFPLCMRQLHDSIRKTHHAKHGTRMQYGLFLKGIGVPLDESVRFWKEEFTKKITPEKFQSHYLYTIRHNYGQEGKRVSYSAYSCLKIMNEAIGSGDCNGCPFKHNGSKVLKQQLENYGIPHLGIQAIMDFVAQHQYQLACTKYFEITHPSVPVEVIQHPNQFFELSRKFHTGNEVPSRRNFESSGRKIKAEKETPKGTANSSDAASANDSLWDPMDIDVSLLLEEAAQAEKKQENVAC